MANRIITIGQKDIPKPSLEVYRDVSIECEPNPNVSYVPEPDIEDFYSFLSCELSRQPNVLSTLIPQELEPLCFTDASQNNDSTVCLQAVNKDSLQPVAEFCNFQYSTDEKRTWNNYKNEIISLNDCYNNKVYFRADPNNPNSNLYKYSGNYHNFKCTGKVKASGNVQSLLSSYTDRIQLSVPAYCFGILFNDCSSLIQAPELPATTLGEFSYFNMFKGCSSLTQAPELPATVLSSGCYYYMFKNCTSLSSIKVKFTSWEDSSGSQIAFNWVDNVHASGKFQCPSALVIKHNIDSVPPGWSVEKF